MLPGNISIGIDEPSPCWEPTNYAWNSVVTFRQRIGPESSGSDATNWQ
jgi:hypothetical protein